MPDSSRLLKQIYRDYAESVGLSPEPQYLHGTPLRPVVPLDRGEGGVFILGAYPSARFAQIGKVSDVPVADNLGPFESERWFDGSRVREQPSAKELNELFLEPMKLMRSKCWITDLVKVFLFKPGHVKRYKALGAVPPAGYTRDRFWELASCEASMGWLEKELKAARPKLMITLGAEVAGALWGVKSSAAQVRLIRPEIQSIEVGGEKIDVLHCAHPGILMRKGPKNPWPKKHWDEFVPVLQKAATG